MSERLLEAFREAAEQHARVPAFETIESGRTPPAAPAPCGGRRRDGLRSRCQRVRRAATFGESPTRNPPRTRRASLTQPYPVMTNTTLDAGTYELRPPRTCSCRPRMSRSPTGWNSSLGPDRFSGVRTTWRTRRTGPARARPGTTGWLLGHPGRASPKRHCDMIRPDGRRTPRRLVGAHRRPTARRDLSAPRARSASAILRLTCSCGRRAGATRARRTLVPPPLEGRIGYLGRRRHPTWVVDVDGRRCSSW